MPSDDAAPRAGAPETDDEGRRRRAAVWFLFVFLVVLFTVTGALALGLVSSGGTGELTVEVVDQNGQAASGQEVQVLDPETGEVVATGTTDEDGEVEFSIDQSDYELVVADKSQDVTLSDETTADLTVDLSPPEPDETWGNGPIPGILPLRTCRCS